MNVSGTSPLANVSMTDLSSHIETSRVLAGKVWDAYVAPSHYRLLQSAGYPSPVPEIVTLLVILATFILTRRLFGWSRGPKGREGDCLMRYVQSRKALQLTQPTPRGKGTPGAVGAEQMQSMMQQVVHRKLQVGLFGLFDVGELPSANGQPRKWRSSELDSGHASRAYISAYTSIPLSLESTQFSGVWCVAAEGREGRGWLWAFDF